MCHPAAPMAMKRRLMLVHSVRRVPLPRASSSHRISLPPHLYSSILGASARVTFVSVTSSVGAPTVVSFTVAPTVPRLASASKGAHSRRCAGSVSASQTFSCGWRSSLTRMHVQFSPSCFRICAPWAGPDICCSRLGIFILLIHLIRVRRLVPHGSITHEDEHTENRQPFQCAKGVDRRRSNKPNIRPSIGDERGDASQNHIERQTKLYSPRTMWNRAARIMISVRPTAANDVSFGLTPVIAGRIKPTPPRNSQRPMKTNRPCGTAENHGTG